MHVNINAQNNIIFITDDTLFFINSLEWFYIPSERKWSSVV